MQFDKSEQEMADMYDSMMTDIEQQYGEPTAKMVHALSNIVAAVSEAASAVHDDDGVKQVTKDVIIHTIQKLANSMLHDLHEALGLTAEQVSNAMTLNVVLMQKMGLVDGLYDPKNTH